ncbi:MAG: hypothetical protein R6U38_05190 [Desulfatiglandaceae bacterium]
MDPNLKKNLRKLAQGAETGVARSLLRWKYKKEGRAAPQDEDLDTQSRKIADEAHTILSIRGKKAWNEVKKVYEKQRAGGEEDNK